MGRNTMITGVQDVYYTVRDMNRAVAFYRDVLGLQPVYVSEHWSAFDVGGVRLGLHLGEGEPPPGRADGAGGAVVTFRVPDLRAAVERLRGLGVVFLGDLLEETYGALIACRDPDGNVFKLMEPRAP